MKKYGIPAILSIIIIAILYYATIPAMNIHSTAFWWFVIYCVIIVTVLFAIPRASDGVSGMILDIQDFFEDLGDTLKAGATRKTPEEKARLEAAKEKREAEKAAAHEDCGQHIENFILHPLQQVPQQVSAGFRQAQVRSWQTS